MIPKLDKDSMSNEKYKLTSDMNLKYKSLQQNISKFNSAILKKNITIKRDIFQNTKLIQQLKINHCNLP